MSKLKNPTELVDRYLQAVRFWLPKTQRQEGLIAELGEDLRSQIEDKESELGHPLDESEVAEILKRCGLPMIVASRLGPKRHLIGPALFPIYAFVLKMVLMWILVPLFLVVLAPINIAQAGADWGGALAGTLGELCSALFIATGIITVIFAVVERTQVLEKTRAPGFVCWDPLNLPPVQKERKPSTLQAVCELAFGFFALIWLLLLRQNPWLILGPAAIFLKAGPIWHVFYPVIVALSILALLRTATILARPQWTLFPLASLLSHEVLGFIVLCFLLSAAGAAPNGEWHPFVMLVQGVHDSASHGKVPGIVNISILVSFVIWWFAQGIALLVHAFQLLQRIRERSAQAQQTASVQAHS